MANDKIIALTATSERRASTMSGYVMLIVLLLAILADVYGVSRLRNGADLTGPYGHCGRNPRVHPRDARLLHAAAEPGGGDHIVRGISRHRPQHGPPLDLAVDGQKKVSVRANNFISEKIKVNDLRGNPIEMAAQIVWRVVDTAQALFDVDDYRSFVSVQVEAAIRTIGSRYPYDDFEHQEVTLRGNHDQVGAELRTELQARLAVAGITVDECGFTHLAYAQEIAGAMLRRQQAQAVVAARKTLVEGAVGMVEMALSMLSEKNVVELDDERRAAMVSNLMVVLCGERDTQPVVNAGTLYQ